MSNLSRKEAKYQNCLVLPFSWKDVTPMTLNSFGVSIGAEVVLLSFEVKYSLIASDF